MNHEAIFQLKVKRLRNGNWTECEDDLVIEEPLEIRLRYGPIGNRLQESISVTMRTPGNDRELALGFLFTEGILKSFDDVKVVMEESAEQNILVVVLKEDAQAFLPQRRNFYATSSCGICGKASIEAITTLSVFADQKSGLIIEKELLFTLKKQLLTRQAVFQSTGGIHASALFDAKGNLIGVWEDVGRHNALDKLIGAAFEKVHLPLSDHILLLSGRASFELVQKAYMAGIKIIAAIGAPSSLSVQLAERHNITLVGFLRDVSLNVYSAYERIR